MNGILRVTCGVNINTPLDPLVAGENILAVANKAVEMAPDVILLGDLCLTGVGCQSAFRTTTLLNAALQGLSSICQTSVTIPSMLIVSLPIRYENRIIPVSAVIHSGKILGLSPSNFSSPYTDNFTKLDDSKIEILGQSVPISTSLCFETEQGATFSVAPTLNIDDMSIANLPDCDVLLIPTAYNTQIMQNDKIKSTLKQFSSLKKCGIALCNIGIGDSTSQYVYQGVCGGFECGEVLGYEQQSNSDAIISTFDFDIEIVKSLKLKQVQTRTNPAWNIPTHFEQRDRKSFFRSIRQNPYLPQDISKAYEFYYDAFNLQTLSLVGRIKGSGITRLVIGVSGGLDSTLALFVACSAFDMLGIPRSDIYAIAMPGLGSSKRTRDNARVLCELLNVSFQEISIKNAVLQHFDDIGHNPAKLDATYENSQARERTQILLDLANSYKALVVGTGDLSEIALGFATFGGDHLASYNPNSNVTKTMIRGVVKYISDNSKNSDISNVLINILNTPVSPELLPTQNSSVGQETEQIVGPYELHDFFLYYFVKYSFSPKRIYEYACFAFAGKYTNEVVKDALKIFVSRFFQNQFKRSCSTESAIISEINLSALNISFPSDVSKNIFLSKLEEL